MSKTIKTAAATPPSNSTEPRRLAAVPLFALSAHSNFSKAQAALNRFASASQEAYDKEAKQKANTEAGDRL